MDRANWGKLVAAFLISILDVVIAAGCRQEQVGSTARIQPQYCSKGFVVPADVDSQQTPTTASTKPAAQKESIGAASTPQAEAAAASTDTRLDSRIDLSSIKADTPFGRAIEVLRNSTRQPINIVVFWNDLRDNAGIDRHTPVGAELIPGVSLRKNLEILLASLSAGRAKLDYAVVDSVVVIATKDSLPKKMLRHTYDITDLSARPADYYSETSGAGVTNQSR